MDAGPRQPGLMSARPSRSNGGANHRRHPRRNGFTLLELLIVIAIAALLLGLLLPSLSGARNNAALLKCQANLREWSHAAILYALDNEGCLPRRGQGAQATTNISRAADWFNALPPLLGMESFTQLKSRGQAPSPGDRTLWVCPKATPVTVENYFAYAMDMWLCTWQDPRPDRIDRVAPTDRQVFMSEGTGGYCSVLPSTHSYSPVARHADLLNVTFLDGHVSAFSRDYVGCGTGDPKRPELAWIVPNSTWPGPSE